MRVKTVILIFLVLILIPMVYGQGKPVEPISRTDDLIKDQHIETRAYIDAKFTEKEESLLKTFEDEKDRIFAEAKQIMWWDRILTMGSLFVGIFLSLTVRSWMDWRQAERIRIIKKQEYEQFKTEMLGDLPTPPNPFGGGGSE